ncbi:MAG: Octanoyltransferase LipM [Deltaproteobacteria bacterium]|jgi:lipoate-protein ligase A|nr:Octanoyltransferase LipM [Deltaproteobacteria bacterium]
MRSSNRPKAQLPESSIRLIRAGRLEPGLTQGLYHSLARGMTESSDDTITLCSPSSPYLCIGYHQVLESVLDINVCRELNLPILRRHLGGGTTYLDSNQIFYQCIFHNSRVPARTDLVYQMMLGAPVLLLNRMGLRGRLRAVNEVEANSVRVAGIGGGRVGEAMVVVGNLLLDFDYNVMSRVWKTPDPLFRKLAQETMQERVGTLNRMGISQTHESIDLLLAKAFTDSLERSLEESEPEKHEIEAAEETARDLASHEFLSLHRPSGSVLPMKSLKISADVFIHQRRVCLDDQQLDVAVRADNGIITDLKTDTKQSKKLRELMMGTSLSEWN